MAANHVVDHFRHAQECAVFEPLGAADDQHLWIKPMPHAFEKGATMLRWHHTDDNLNGIESNIQVAGRFDRFWQSEFWQESLVDPVRRDAFHDVCFIGPQRDTIYPFTREYECQ